MNTKENSNIDTIKDIATITYTKVYEGAPEVFRCNLQCPVPKYDCSLGTREGVSMVSVSTRTDRSHRFLFVILKVEFTKIDLGYLDGEEAEKLADEFQAISNEIRDFANWSKKQG